MRRWNRWPNSDESSLDADAFLDKFTGEYEKTTRVVLEGEGFSLIDADGKLVPEVGRILHRKKYNMVLANGPCFAARDLCII